MQRSIPIIGLLLSILQIVLYLTMLFFSLQLIALSTPKVKTTPLTHATYPRYGYCCWPITHGDGIGCRDKSTPSPCCGVQDSCNVFCCGCITCLSAPGATHEEDVENGMMGGKTQEEREVDRLMEMKRGEEELTLEKYLDIVGGMRPEFLEDESMRETLVAYYFRKNAEGDGRHGLVGDGEVADLEDATVMDDSQAVVKPSSGQKVMKDL